MSGIVVSVLVVEMAPFVLSVRWPVIRLTRVLDPVIAHFIAIVLDSSDKILNLNIGVLCVLNNATTTTTTMTMHPKSNPTCTFSSTLICWLKSKPEISDKKFSSFVKGFTALPWAVPTMSILNNLEQYLEVRTVAVWGLFVFLLIVRLV